MAESGFLFSFVVYLSGGPACSPIKYIHDVKSLFDVIVKYIHDVKSLFNNILLILPVKNRIVPLSGTITCSVLLGVLVMCCCVFHILKPYISRKLSFSPFDSCRIYGQRTCRTEVTSRKVRICTDFANIGCWHNRKIQLPGIVCRCRTYTRHKLTYNILGHAGRA
jgi:hypothetical protein